MRQFNLGHMTKRARTPRRWFLKRIGALVGGALLWRVQPVATESTMAMANSPGNHLSTALGNRPTPAYIPPHYSLVEVYTQRRDGLGGPDEVTYWYADQSSRLGMNNPLAIFAAPQPVRRSLVGEREGHPAMLSMGSGETVEAEYHDGWWIYDPASDGPAWERSNVHSLTLPWRGYTIAVRGARLAGITEQELIRVASSLT